MTAQETFTALTVATFVCPFSLSISLFTFQFFTFEVFTFHFSAKTMCPFVLTALNKENRVSQFSPNHSSFQILTQWKQSDQNVCGMMLVNCATFCPITLQVVPLNTKQSRIHAWCKRPFNQLSTEQALLLYLHVHWQHFVSTAAL